MKKSTELYRGKAKTVFTTDDPEYYIMRFRDDTSALDGKITRQLERKGRTNNHFSFFIMRSLERSGISTHCVKLVSDDECLVKKLKMIPVEFVVRNLAAGSICRRLGIKEGLRFKKPVLELFLKNDELHDPMVNESYAQAFGWATSDELESMKTQSLRINEILSDLFAKAGLTLVDFKLEFGIDTMGNLTLGDEFSPDCCRLWDTKTMERFDKDRFRQNLGHVVEGYEEAARRIGCPL